MALGDRYSFIQAQRIQHLIDDLNLRIEGHEERLNSDFIKREEFWDLLAEVTGQYIKTSEPVRQDYYAGLLIGAMTQKQVSAERDFFIKKIDDLSTVHLELLRLAYNMRKALEAKSLDLQKGMNKTIIDLMRYYLEGVDLEIINAAHKDLYSQGFFSIDADTYDVYANNLGHDTFNHILTPMGRKFVMSCLPLKGAEQ